jgi:DNA modification methylase
MNIAKRYEIIPLDKIVPYAKNTKKHSQEQVAQIRASFREFGVLSPCLVDEGFNLLSGHGRLSAARQEGLSEINCVVVEGLTKTQKQAYIITDNKIGENATWDTELLSIELSELQGADFDVSLLGFDDAELNVLMGGAENVKDDEFDVDNAAKEPSFVLPGDLWTLGRHRLLCGDATNAADIERLMGGNKANIVLTDLPYGVGYESKAGKIKNDNLTDAQFYDFLLAAFNQMKSAMADDACIYVFYADSKGLIFRRAFDDAGMYLSGNCIWEKNTFTLGRSDYQWQHEVCMYGWKKTGKHKWYGDRKQSTIWHCDKPKKNDIHPTMKPIPLLAIPLMNSTMTNSIVLDPFAGSFSTGIACEQMGRICYGMELDPVYAGVSVKRYIEQAGSADGVFVERTGVSIPFIEVCKAPESSK